MTWKEALQIGQEMILATSSKDGNPHAIIVICKGILDDKILINVCQMKTSLENIKNNNRVCLISIYNKEYYRITGKAALHSSGKYFDLAVERNVPNTPKPKYALTIDIEEVVDVDNLRKVV